MTMVCLEKGCSREMKNQIRNPSGDELIGLHNELIWNTREEKNQDLHLDFWPEELDRW